MLGPIAYTSRRSESDLGETLQTDVMRFMAILALCLVAIFALVQSLPLGSTMPAQEQPEVIEGKNTVVRSLAESVPALSPDIAVPESELRIVEAPVVEAPVVEAPVVEAPVVEAPVVEAPVVEAPQSLQTSDKGMTLRFSSDTAFLALSAQRKIKVFALASNTAWQLVNERGVLQFATASRPRKFHAMTADTVPAKVRVALTSMVPSVRIDSDNGGVTFAVSLSTDIDRQLQRLVDRHRTGQLVIHADSRVLHEQGG